MSTATDSRNGNGSPSTLAAIAPDVYGQPPRPIASFEQLEFGAAYSETVLRYLFRILPAARSELAHWRERAEMIPSPALRAQASAALLKRGNIEGAALFATLAPPRYRSRTVSALVAFQSAYNYLDALSELPSEDPVANGAQLHQALLVALHPHAAHGDYYEHNRDTGDGGYLVAMVDACRGALAGLPSFDMVASTARSAAGRIVDFQSLNLSDTQGGHDGMRKWATEETPPGSGLRWFETAAATGSSLAVHALIAAAAAPGLDYSDAREIDRAYFPWTGALHSLLDSLVDRYEDHAQARQSLLAYYQSPGETAIRLGLLATRARRGLEKLPAHDSHRTMLTAMCSYYLSAPAVKGASSLTCNVSEALGVPLSIAVLMFRARRLASTLMHGSYT
jgi:tetraprenyl-beta-curcumene synthase